MPVVSTTLAGVNVFQFSGAVTDAEIKTAWAGTIVNGVYVLNRAIYLDNTADLSTLTGGFLINFGTQVSPAFILHTGRDKTKSIFKNFTFIQSTGLSVGARSNFVNTWNGTTLSTPVGADGVSQSGGGMVYGVAGNPGGGDPRFLNEMSFAGLEGVTIFSQEYTEQELQIVISQTSTLKGITFEKCFGFPQIGSTAATGNVNIVVYRSTQNTQNATQYPLRIYPSGNTYSAVCYVDSYVTRNNTDITTRLADFFGANATSRAVVVILNNYTRESWFGATKTNFSAMGNWNTANQIWGGVLKKLQFVGGGNGVVKCYDSRSTTTSQKSKFLESGSVDFLDASIAPTTDSEGRISLVHIGALSTGGTSNSPITRYTGQIYTFQKFGFRVIVATPDMSAGDNDLSAFTPVILTTQNGLVRTQVEIQSAITITTFREVIEELHNLAIISSGANSYNAPYNGNLFSLDGRSINTEFDSIVINPNATNKIAYDSVTNTLTIKSSVISSTTNVNEWRNSGGTFDFQNGSQINGVFADDDGSHVNVFNLDPENFGVTWFLRYKKTSSSTWTEISGTGNATTILADLDVYDIMARVPGYEWKEIQFDTNESLSIDLNLSYHVSANNTPQYTMSFDANLESKINFDPVANSVSVENETGVITNPGFAELYRATQRIQHLPLLVWTFTAPITANSTSQKILIPNGNMITFFLTDSSTASVKITCPVIHADTGESADDRVRGNASGFSIILGSPATAESAGLQSAIVSDILAKLGGAGYSIENDNLKKINEKVQTLENTDLTGIATSQNVTDAKTEILTAISEIPTTDVSALALESSVQSVKTKVNSLPTLAEMEDNNNNLAKEISVIGLNTGINSIENKVLSLNDDMQVVNNNLDDIKGEYFDINTDSLNEISTKVNEIKSKTDALENYDDTTLTSKVDAIQTSIDDIDIDFTPVLQAVDLTLKSSEYTAPDNAKITEIKTKVDTLNNTDISTLSKKADTDLLLKANDYSAPDNGKIAEIKTKVDTLENTDLTGISTTTDVETAKTEILTAVNDIEIDNEAIATEVWNKEPERLKQVATVQTTGEQIANFNI